MGNSNGVVLAAGAVLWRPSKKHGVKVALIHRPRYDDWSLPKGKAEGTEVPMQTAVREVKEETGYLARLGRTLTTTEYDVAAGRKTVHYFSGRCLGGEFRPNREVDELTWRPVGKARKQLSYERDRRVLDAFTALPAQLSTVVLVRHAHAGRRDAFSGADDQRPLDDKGLHQAAALTPLLTAFGPVGVAAAPLVRCEQTVHLLAGHLGVAMQEEPALTEREYQHDPAAARRRVIEMAVHSADAGPMVVCSQGGVIPGVVKSLASRGQITLPTTDTPKASWWVLSFEGKHLRQADRYLLTDS